MEGNNKLQCAAAIVPQSFTLCLHCIERLWSRSPSVCRSAWQNFMIDCMLCCRRRKMGSEVVAAIIAEIQWLSESSRRAGRAWGEWWTIKCASAAKFMQHQCSGGVVSLQLDGIKQFCGNWKWYCFGMMQQNSNNNKWRICNLCESFFFLKVKKKHKLHVHCIRMYGIGHWDETTP